MEKHDLTGAVAVTDIGVSEAKPAPEHSAMTAKASTRPLANFTPSTWDKSFASFAMSEQREMFNSYAGKFEELKGEVKKLLLASTCDRLQNFRLIDLLEHLGVSYLFEPEIDMQLEQHFSTELDIDHSKFDLYNVSLLFRVFRQHGYNLCSEVFKKFMDGKGKFNEGLVSDIKGMLSLYEATHCRTKGDETLEEAFAFTSTHLKTLTKQSSNDRLAKEVMHSLEHPIHKCIPRVETRRYIDVYQEDKSRNETLLQFAKLDFNRLQLLYRQEIIQVFRWWNGLVAQFPYARDRVVELHFWTVAIYVEPRYSRARIIFCKLLIMWTLVDDTYDSYGTLEELKKLTGAIQRWNLAAADDLPDYMKILYKALLNMLDEFDKEIGDEGVSYIVDFTKEEMKEITRGFYQEAKWFNEGYVPKFDEYMAIASRTASGRVIMAASFMGMEDLDGKEVADWLRSYPKIIRTVDKVGRLINDMAGHEFEQKRGHVPSAVECYMLEHGVEKEEVIEVFKEEIVNEWKELNEEYLKPSGVPKHARLRAVNFVRLYNLVYGYGDAVTEPHILKGCYTSLFIDQIPV